MTKLPKRLEKVIEQKAESLEDMNLFNEAEACRTCGTDIALEVKQMADKLAEASRAFLLNRSIENSQKLNSALAEWDEFWRSGE